MDRLCMISDFRDDWSFRRNWKDCAIPIANGVDKEHRRIALDGHGGRWAQSELPDWSAG